MRAHHEANNLRVVIGQVLSSPASVKDSSVPMAAVAASHVFSSLSQGPAICSVGHSAAVERSWGRTC